MLNVFVLRHLSWVSDETILLDEVTEIPLCLSSEGLLKTPNPFSWLWTSAAVITVVRAGWIAVPQPWQL